jgi:cytochrome c oxidase cbb3-type subunit IV
MLKFIRNHADKIENINIFPLIGLAIFVVFFILMLIYVKNMPREELSELSHLPLDLQEPNQPLNL